MALKYVDFGFSSAREFWLEVVLPASVRYQRDPTRAHAIEAALSAWHVHEWIYDETPSLKAKYVTRKCYEAALVQTSHELGYLRDVGDAGKHRGLNRPSVNVKKVGDKEIVEGPLGTVAFGELAFSEIRMSRTPLLLTLDDGTIRGFAQVLSTAIAYWQLNHFL